MLCDSTTLVSALRPPFLAWFAELKAAAKAAAAKALAAGVSTLLAEDLPTTAPAHSPGGQGAFKAPPPRPRSTSPAATAGGMKCSPVAAPAAAPDSPSGSAGENPLASLLGYTDDDSESPRAAQGSSSAAGAARGPSTAHAAAGSSAGQAPDGPSQGAAAQAAAAPQQQAGAAPASAAEQGSGGRLSGDAMDAQLADFLADLESNGLLADVNGEGDGGAAAAAAPAASSQQGTQQAQHEIQAEQQGASPAQAEQQGGEAALGPAAGDTAGGGGGGSQAEQRVLGPVEGTAGAGWFLVLDTGSRRQYYWNQETNEVAWTAPAGSVLPPATAAAAEAAALQPAAAGQQMRAGSSPQPTAEAPAQPAQAGAATTGGAEVRAQEGAAAARPDVQSLAAAFLVAPTATALQAAEQIAEQCTEAAGELLDSVPRVSASSPALWDTGTCKAVRAGGEGRCADVSRASCSRPNALHGSQARPLLGPPPPDGCASSL